MAKNKLEEFCKSIEKEYGKSNTEKNGIVSLLCSITVPFVRGILQPHVSRWNAFLPFIHLWVVLPH